MKNKESFLGFYLKPTTESPTKPDISFNGKVIADPEELHAILLKQSAEATYETETYNCHAINTNYNIGSDEASKGPNKDGKKISMVVMIDGEVIYSKGTENEEVRNFSESIILVPNWKAQRPNAPKGLRKWLIASQNFRVVV